MTAILNRRGGAGLVLPEATGDDQPAGRDGQQTRATSNGAPPSARRLRRLWIVPAGVVVAGALALLPAVRDGGPGPGEAEVVVAGAAEVVRADGTRSTVTDDTVRLGRGDSLEVARGTARFELADEVRFEGHAGAAAGGRTGTTVRMDLTPELVAGRLLVVAPESTAVQAAGTTVQVAPSGGRVGAARLDRRLGLGIGTYRGQVDVDSAGRAATVPDLHRIEVATPGSVGRRDLALRYAADDGWDRRFLGDALTVDRQLAPLLAGLSASGGPDLTSADGLRRALPGLPSEERLAPLLADVRSDGDALVLAALTDRGEGGTFASRWDAAVRFHGDGARWGLVALDRDVAPAELLGAIRGSLDRLSFAFGAEADADGRVDDADGPGVDGGLQGAETPASEGNVAPDAEAGDEPGAGGSGSGSGEDGPAEGPGASVGDPATGGPPAPPPIRAGDPASGGPPAPPPIGAGDPASGGPPVPPPTGGGAPTAPPTGSADPPAPDPGSGPSPDPEPSVPPLLGGGDVPDVPGPLPPPTTVPPVPPAPDVTVPSVPGVTAPTVPDVTVPPVPEVTTPPVPDVTVPEVTTPPVPDVTVPPVPDVTVPDVTTPPVPDVTVPRVPDVTVPSVPEVTDPSPPTTTVPPVPDVSVPGATDASGGLLGGR